MEDYKMKKTPELFLQFFGPVWGRTAGAVLLFIFSSALVRAGGAFAQSQFQRAVGGTNYDYAYSIVQTTDGGYAAAGVTYSFGAGGADFYIVKLDASGSVQWSRTVGGTNDDYAYSIVQTTDGGYAAAGATNSFGAGGYDMYIVKLDGSGSVQWSRTVGGTNDDYANSIVQTTDGGYAAAGRTDSFGAGNSDIYIVKLDATGTVQWSRTVGGTNYDYANSIVQTTDGGYAAAGPTDSFGAGGTDFYIVKLDATGTVQWSRTVGGTNQDYAYSIVQTTDGGYAAAGMTNSFVGAGNSDMYIVKLDASGSVQWSRTVGGTNYDYDFANSIVQTTDGGYAAAGSTYFGAVNSDMYIVKLAASGSVQWSRTVGGTNYDFAYSIVQTTDGGYAAAGLTYFGAGNQDMYIVKLDASGNICGNSTSPSSISGTGGTTTSPTSTVTTPASTVTTPSPTTSTGGTLTSICLVAVQPISNEIPSEFKLEQNYPNPFNPSTTIRFEVPRRSSVELSVFNVLGQKVATLLDEERDAGRYSVVWHGTNDEGLKMGSGVYFYRIRAEDGRSGTRFVETKKLLLLK